MRSTLIKLLSGLGSLRLALIGMLTLAVTALVTYKNPDISINWVVLPLAVLALNLLAAIVTNRRFREQGGLLTFHIGLLLIVTLAAIGILTSLDARLEITEGMEFNPDDVEIVHRGSWHVNHLDQIDFTQGKVAVGFVAAQRRGDTSSRIWFPADSGQPGSRDIGDNRSLQVSGYRFITTGNKGYSVILTWTGDTGQTVTGSVHMPTYPLYEWRQENSWSTPEGQQLLLSLLIDNEQNLKKNSTWTLTSSNLKARLLITVSGNRHVLEPGDEIRLEHGILRFEDARVWMGYRIDYNPMLPWQLIAALLAIIGLGVHFRNKFAVNTIQSRRKAWSGNLEHTLNV